MRLATDRSMPSPSDPRTLEPLTASIGAVRSFPARYSIIPETARFIETFCASHDVGRDDGLRLALIVEELVANTIVHGHGGESDAPIVIGFSVAADAVTLRYEDTAPAFDFAAARAQTIDPLDVEFDLRPVGNLGLRLLSHYADSVSYARTSGRNQITLTLRRSP
jgi:anti-sigma regulatory factor (Ser/Thr protein kinase)